MSGAPRPVVGTASVGYLFGVLAARAIPGTVLVPLLTDLGMSVPGARTMLHRMRAAGAVTVSKVGRVAVYRLAGVYLEHYRKITFAAPVPDWAGAFQAIVYDIPETHRHERDRLREQAFQSGYAAVRSGLLIGVARPGAWLRRWLDRSEWMVEQAELRCELPAARRLADRAWGLAAIADRIEVFDAALRQVERRVAGQRFDGPGALCRLYEIWQEFVAIQILAPSLPGELYPSRWGMAGMQNRVYRVNAALLPLANAHAQAVVGRAGAAELIEHEPQTPRSAESDGSG